MCVPIYIYIDVCMCVFIYVYIYIDVSIYVLAHKSIYIYRERYTCMYIYIYTFLLSTKGLESPSSPLAQTNHGFTQGFVSSRTSTQVPPRDAARRHAKALQDWVAEALGPRSKRLGFGLAFW